MKYVALLRGINVGGNNTVKMSLLKEVFEKHGYKNVLTYINSGNVIFESEEKNIEKLTNTLELLISERFNYEARVITKSHEQIKHTVQNVPSDWNTRNDIRCYVGFLAHLPSKEEIAEIPLKEGVDELKVVNDVLYMTSLLSQLTKSALNKLTMASIYKDLTIRNFNTTRKILALMAQ